MALRTRPERIGADRVVIDAVPIITAGIYAINDVVGGRLQFSRATRGSGHTAVIESVRLVDRASQNVALDLVLFDQPFTEIADNAVFAPSDADLDHCVGVINIPASAYFTFSTNAVAVLPLTDANWGQGFPVSTAGSDVLYGQLVVRGGPPTYVATNDLRLRLLLRRE